MLVVGVLGFVLYALEIFALLILVNGGYVDQHIIYTDWLFVLPLMITYYVCLGSILLGFIGMAIIGITIEVQKFFCKT